MDKPMTATELKLREEEYFNSIEHQHSLALIENTLYDMTKPLINKVKEMTLPRHAIPEERPVCAALIQTMLDASYSVTVNDGEDVAIEKSCNKANILEAMASTGGDWIYGYNCSIQEKPLVAFYLIYNNGSKYDPMVVIADHWDNDASEKIWNELNGRFG